MKCCRPGVIAGLAVSLVALLAADAFAATNNYGDKNGVFVDFVSIRETATNPDPPLFVDAGDANNILVSSTGNSDKITFDPDPNFMAETLSAGTFVLVDSTLKLDIFVTDSSKRIKEIIIRESGDFNLTGSSEAQVVTNLEWKVTQVDFSSAPGSVTQQQNMMDFTPLGTGGDPNGGHYATPGDSSGQFSGLLELDVESYLSNLGVSGGATAIEIFTVNNELTAEVFSGGGTSTIQKKGFEIEVILVPEPGTAALFGLGLIGLGYAGRTRPNKR